MNEPLPEEIVWNNWQHREKYEPEKLWIHFEGGSYVQKLRSTVDWEIVVAENWKKFETEMECLLDRISQLNAQWIDVSFE